MSLLNDMLQDLQQQPDADPHASDENNRAQLKDSGMIKTTSVPWRTSVLVFLAVLVALLLLKQPLNSLFGDGQPKARPLLSLDQPVATPQKQTEFVPLNQVEAINTADIQANTSTDDFYPLAVQQALVQHQQNPAVETAGQPEIQPTQITLEQQAQIEQLLIRARQAIARDRLTSPFEDNAYQYYQQVLAIEPGNTLAQQGILQLADRYLAMADKRLSQDNKDAAHRLLQRAQLVAPAYEAVIIFAKKWPENFQQVELIDEPLVNNDSTNTADNVSTHEVALEKSTSVSIQDPFGVTTESSHLSVTPNAQWQDQDQAQQAQLLLQQGKQAEAISLLENFIASNGQAKHSTRILLDMYCQQGRVENARSLLGTATYLEKVDQHYYQARLALMNNQGQEALDLLEAELPLAEKHEQYRALLAGLYQKTARYPEAATNYKRMLEVFGEKPAYWLGYALALDALEQKASALQAYRRLSEYTELQAEVRQYIEQRIAALQG